MEDLARQKSQPGASSDLSKSQDDFKKTFFGRIWRNQIWRVLFLAVLIVLVSGSTGLAWYSYQRYQIRKQLSAAPSPSADSATTPTAAETAASTASPTAAPTPTSTATSNTPAPTSTPTGVSAKTINDSATQLVAKQSGYCHALAPEDWAITTNQEASGADLFSPDQKKHAGWGITFVYSYMYPSEDDFLNTWMPLAGYSGISMGGGSDMGYGFTKRDFTSSNGKKGFLFYKKYDASDLGGYIMSVYMAATNSDIWDSQGATAGFAAVSIRCVTQLRPNTSGSNPSSSGSNSEVSLSDKWTEAIMGYENVYSPTTGDHYEAPLNSYSETGPDGPGYYRSVPNGYEKLERGFGSY